jgi:sugar phosphate isomerase/epimerase
MYLEKAIDIICNAKAEYMEIFVNTTSELDENFLKEQRRKLDENGVKCVALHPFTCVLEPMMLFSEYERRVGDFLEFYKKYFAAANILGAEIFVLHGNKNLVPVPRERYFERFQKLYETGREYGVTVAQENINRCESCSLEFLKDMLKNLGDKAKFVLDIKQCIRSGEDIFKTAAALKDNILHIHLSDHGEKGDCLLVGEGDFDFGKFVRKMSDYGYTGAYILELYRKNYGTTEELIDNYHYFRKILQDF